MKPDRQFSLFESPGSAPGAEGDRAPEGAARDATPPGAPTTVDGPGGREAPAPPASLPPGTATDPAAGPPGGEGVEPGAAPESALPVSAVNAAAREALETRFRPLWVSGEVANWRRHGSGHCWFTIRDETSQLSCVMFRSDAARLPTDPDEGMAVCVFGQLTLYETRGTFQIVVRELRAVGEGLWRLAFERLRAKLAAEGLLDPDRKRPLPRVPLRVGVVTSRTGAALRDVLAVVHRRAPWTRILVSHCRVQGDGAAEEIRGALARLVDDGGCDVIVLTRGGGSTEDLWAFNEEPVARAIAACPIPTVSAVGHEIDVTIADLVADVRAPTPSAAAETVVPDGGALRAELQALAAGLVEGLRDRGRRAEERAARGADRIRTAIGRRLEALGARRTLLAGRLEALSPLATLRRGYAVPLGPDGSVLRTASDFSPGEAFRLRTVDARVEARVESVEELEAATPGPRRPADEKSSRAGGEA